MERDARLYWLNDGRYLIVNYFAGSDSTRPLAIRLDQGPTKSIDLSKVVLPDVLRRVHKRLDQVYHYYAWFVADDGKRNTIVAEPEYTLRGTSGPGGGRCLVYSIDKTTFRGYRFLREVDNVDICPEIRDDGS